MRFLWFAMVGPSKFGHVSTQMPIYCYDLETSMLWWSTPLRLYFDDNIRKAISMTGRVRPSQPGVYAIERLVEYVTYHGSMPSVPQGVGDVRLVPLPFLTTNPLETLPTDQIWRPLGHSAH